MTAFLLRRSGFVTAAWLCPSFCLGPQCQCRSALLQTISLTYIGLTTELRLVFGFLWTSADRFYRQLHLFAQPAAWPTDLRDLLRVLLVAIETTLRITGRVSVSSTESSNGSFLRILCWQLSRSDSAQVPLAVSLLLTSSINLDVPSRVWWHATLPISGTVEHC